MYTWPFYTIGNMRCHCCKKKKHEGKNQEFASWNHINPQQNQEKQLGSVLRPWSFKLIPRLQRRVCCISQKVVTYIDILSSIPLNAPCITRQRKTIKINRSFHTRKDLIYLEIYPYYLLRFPFLPNHAQRVCSV